MAIVQKNEGKTPTWIGFGASGAENESVDGSNAKPTIKRKNRSWARHKLNGSTAIERARKLIIKQPFSL